MSFWPGNGTDAVEIMNQNFALLIDVDILSTKGFASFYGKWTRNDSYGKKKIYVQCMNENNNNIQNISRLRFIEPIQSTDYIGFAKNLKQKGKNWIYFTKPGREAEEVREASRNENIYIRLYCLDDKGYIQGYYSSKNTKGTDNKKGKNIQIDAFEISTNITPFYQVNYSDSKIPTTGDIVFDSNNEPIRLGQEFISNPQSITYQTNTNAYQAKIYQKSWLKVSYFKDKVKKMLEHPVKMDGICWPVDMLYNSNKEFVGILVPKAEGYQLKQDVMSQVGLEQHFPNWDRRSLTHVTRIILEKISYLQERNVIFGLINANTIFVKDIDHIYLTEMDMLQIEGFPILSYEKVMQAPELQDSRHELRLYTKQQDNYEIAMLTFMLLMPGKFPYNKGKNKSISDSIKRMSFAFHYGGNNRGEHGSREYFGSWRFVWSHLGNDLKKAFYETFQYGQAYSKPENRRDAKFWYGKVRNLEEELKNPYDNESLKMFPRTFKRYSGTKTITCRKCGIDHPLFYYRYPERQICNSCIGKISDTFFVCKNCQVEYYYDYSTLFKYEKLVETKGFKMPTHCPYCRSDKDSCKECNRIVPTYRLNEMGMCPDCAKKRSQKIVGRYTCLGCRRVINITQGEMDFYEKKGWNTPTRCKDCRSKRKNY